MCCCCCCCYLLLLSAGILQLLKPVGTAAGALDPDAACCAVGVLSALGQDSRRMQEMVRTGGGGVFATMNAAMNAYPWMSP
jgi:hypothetical protein